MVGALRRVVRRAASASTKTLKTPFNTGLLDILACPFTKQRLQYREAEHCLHSEEIGVNYHISKDTGIPNMIPHDAELTRPLSTSSPSSKSDI